MWGESPEGGEEPSGSSRPFAEPWHCLLSRGLLKDVTDRETNLKHKKHLKLKCRRGRFCRITANHRDALTGFPCINVSPYAGVTARLKLCRTTQSSFNRTKEKDFQLKIRPELQLLPLPSCFTLSLFL